MAIACALPLSSRSVFSTRGEDIDRDFDGAPPPPSFTGASAWYLTCGLAGAAVSEQVAIDAVGRPRCFGCLTAFPWAAAQHEVQRASGEMSPAPTPGGRGHPPGGRDL